MTLDGFFTGELWDGSLSMVSVTFYDDLRPACMPSKL